MLLLRQVKDRLPAKTGIQYPASAMPLPSFGLDDEAAEATEAALVTPERMER